MKYVEFIRDVEFSEVVENLKKAFKGKAFIMRATTLEDMKDLEWSKVDDEDYTDDELNRMKNDYITFESV